MENHRFAEMISKIAHELRSPLTSIKGFSSTLVQRWDRFTDEQRRQFVETIHADSERMGRIVSEVLDLARLESGRLELHEQRTNLHAICETAAGHMSKLPGADRLVLDVGEDVYVLADPDRISHAIRNLVENAIKFSDEGRIGVTAGPTGGGMVELRITDEGVGIDESRMEELFSGPAPTAQKSGPSGSGLGLYLTKRLIEAHGGTITVESKPAVGSTFIVTLKADA